MPKLYEFRAWPPLGLCPIEYCFDHPLAHITVPENHSTGIPERRHIEGVFPTTLPSSADDPAVVCIESFWWLGHPLPAWGLREEDREPSRLASHYRGPEISRLHLGSVRRRLRDRG